MKRASMYSFALEYAKDIRTKDPGIGGVKLWHMYQQQFKCTHSVLGRDAFIDLLSESHMMVRMVARKPKTTDSSHGLPTYPNLTYDYIPTAINQLWVSDITYIPIWTSDGEYAFCYLSVILDTYSKEIVGWSVGDSLQTIYPLQALKMALPRLKVGACNLIHHSDRGVQYASSEYTKTLTAHNIRISMTENGDPKENAQAERINNTIKNELLKDKRFHNIAEVRDAMAKAVDFYNNARPHMSLNMQTPTQAAKCEGPINKLWTSYRERAIVAMKKEVDVPSNIITEKIYLCLCKVDSNEKSTIIRSKI